MWSRKLADWILGVALVGSCVLTVSVVLGLLKLMTMLVDLLSKPDNWPEGWSDGPED